MNKQSISFKADEQKLTKTGGIEHYASNIVAYIEATFDLGANWNGYDSVRAVWSNDYLTDISTVLDNNGKCIVPTEVLTDTGNVTVNLVGSIADGDTLTDRLTTYPCKAVIVDADAKVEGDETESITPSQFEQFVEIVHGEVEQVTGMTAEAETLPAGSDATASYSDGVLSFGIPRGDKGEQGEQGETGHTGAPAGFGDVTASVDNTVGTPSVNVTASGPDTAKEFDFEFHNLKGEQGDTGETGATGNGIASTVLNPDYTLTITFTDGTSYTTPSIRGAKGDTGNTGATGNGIQSTVLNADYTLTITFTDGTSYTTPSIRGEQGPAGPVSDVTVNGTSVVDQNGVAVITMPELVKTVQGNPIVLDDAFGEVKKLTVELLPIQEGSGTPSPQNVRPITGHDSVTVGVTGVNQWDEEWEVGTINSATGENDDTIGYLLRSKNYIPIADDKTYYCYCGIYGITEQPCGTRFYDANKNYIGRLNAGGQQIYWNAPAGATQACNPPSEARYMRFVTRADYGTTYNHDISINLPSTDTSYHAYYGHTKTVTLPHTVYGAGVGVTSGTGKEKQSQPLDLGTLTWETTPNGYLARNAVQSRITDTADIGKGFLCSALASPYPAKTGLNAWNNLSNGEMAVFDTQVRVGDTTHATPAEFKQAMSGVMLVYEVKTPTDLSTTPTDITLYSGDNVISSDGDMELTYVQDMATVIRKIENQL